MVKRVDFLEGVLHKKKKTHPLGGDADILERMLSVDIRDLGDIQGLCKEDLLEYKDKRGLVWRDLARMLGTTEQALYSCLRKSGHLSACNTRILCLVEQLMDLRCKAMK